MTAADPPPAPDWPASCGAAAARREGAPNRAPTVSPPPLPGAPSAAAKTRRSDPGPERAGLPEAHGACPAGAAGRGDRRAWGGRGRCWRRLRALRAAIGQRSPIPAAWRVRAAAGCGEGMGVGARRASGRRSREPRAPRRAEMGDAEGAPIWAHMSHLPFLLNGGAPMQRDGSAPGDVGSPLGREDGPADPRSALSGQHARRCWQGLGQKGGAEGADSARSGLRILIFEPQSRPERKFTRAFLACWVTGAGGERGGERQPRGPRSAPASRLRREVSSPRAAAHGRLPLRFCSAAREPASPASPARGCCTARSQLT